MGGECERIEAELTRLLKSIKQDNKSRLNYIFGMLAAFAAGAMTAAATNTNDQVDQVATRAAAPALIQPVSYNFPDIEVVYDPAAAAVANHVTL